MRNWICALNSFESNFPILTSKGEVLSIAFEFCHIFNLVILITTRILLLFFPNDLFRPSLIFRWPRAIGAACQSLDVLCSKHSPYLISSGNWMSWKGQLEERKVFGLTFSLFLQVTLLIITLGIRRFPILISMP